MNPEPQPDPAEPPGAVACWCCGGHYPDDQVIHLGQHPEVALCHRCARWAHRRAVEQEDTGRDTVATRLRDLVRAGRAQIIARGWHERGPLGALLRRIDRHLP